MYLTLCFTYDKCVHVLNVEHFHAYQARKFKHTSLISYARIVYAVFLTL